MYQVYFGFHLFFAFFWVAFFLILNKIAEYSRKDEKFYLILTIILIVLLLVFGSKMLLINPAITKSGGWLHTKLSIFILLILENLYFAYLFMKNKAVSPTVLKYLYAVNVVLIAVMLLLSIFKPF